MCLPIMIVMLIFGVVIFVRGKYRYRSSGEVREVRGSSARVIGILLITPLPLFYLLGGVLLQLEKVVNAEQKVILKPAFGILIMAIPVCCLIAAFSIASSTSKPEAKDAVKPEGHDEHSPQGSSHSTKSQGITGEPSHPPPSLDDQIQS